MLTPAEITNPERRKPLGDVRYMGMTAVVTDASPLYELIDAAHTDRMALLAQEHGLSVRRGVIGSSPNDADFAATFGLSRRQLEAVGWYKGSGSSFNSRLRGDSVRAVGEQHMITLQEMLSGDCNLPVTQGGELVFRGTPATNGGTELGFTSVTYSVRTAAGFARGSYEQHGAGYIQRLALPPGIRYLPIGTYESEILLPTGLSTRLVASHTPGSDDFTRTLDEAGSDFSTSNLSGVVDFLVPPQ